MTRYLITGGCGFLGTNLAAEALAGRGELIVVDNLSRPGSRENLAWLRGKGAFAFHGADVRNAVAVDHVVKDCKPDVVFHLAGQVAMTTSIHDPRMDFEINALGTLNVLDAVRRLAPDAALIYSSTNKVYGDLEWVRYGEEPTRYTTPEFPDGFDERTPLSFHSPYGCSKGAADQYCLDFARIFGLRTTVLRHSSIYGARQFSTIDQGWIGWFCKMARAASGRAAAPFTISGNGKQVRDVLHAEDLVGLYYAIPVAGDTVRGRAFNVGGGAGNSLSLLELFALLEGELSIKLAFERLPPRESDQKVFVANNAMITEATGWRPRVSAREGVHAMLRWTEEIGLSGRAGRDGHTA